MDFVMTFTLRAQIALRQRVEYEKRDGISGKV